MIIFPAIDILNGWCVRLRQGKYEAVTIYAEDPSEMALAWQSQGARWLHVVDLDGAKEGHPVNLAAVDKIVKKAEIPIQFGGGLRSEADIKQLFDIGVSRIVLGTTLVTDPDFAKSVIGAGRDGLVAAVDGRNGKVAISGWREETDVDVVTLASELEKLGVTRFIYTDINVDGTRKGPNFAAIRALAEAVGVPVIASGGVSSLGDIEALRWLEQLGIEGVIIGSALYEKIFTLPEAIEAAGG